MLFIRSVQESISVSVATQLGQLNLQFHHLRLNDRRTNAVSASLNSINILHCLCLPEKWVMK